MAVTRAPALQRASASRPPPQPTSSARRPASRACSPMKRDAHRIQQVQRPELPLRIPEAARARFELGQFRLIRIRAPCSAPVVGPRAAHAAASSFSRRAQRAGSAEFFGIKGQQAMLADGGAAAAPDITDIRAGGTKDDRRFDAGTGAGLIESRSMQTRSAALPTSREPMCACRPSTVAPPRVAKRSISAAGSPDSSAATRASASRSRAPTAVGLSVPRALR